jgi:hypothetical protein
VTARAGWCRVISARSARVVHTSNAVRDRLRGSSGEGDNGPGELLLVGLLGPQHPLVLDGWALTLMGKQRDLSAEDIPRGTTRVLAERGHLQVGHVDELTTRMPTPEEVAQQLGTWTPVLVYVRTGYTSRRPVRVRRRDPAAGGCAVRAPRADAGRSTAKRPSFQIEHLDRVRRADRDCDQPVAGSTAMPTGSCPTRTARPTGRSDGTEAAAGSPTLTGAGDQHQHLCRGESIRSRAQASTRRHRLRSAPTARRRHPPAASPRRRERRPAWHP